MSQAVHVKVAAVEPVGKLVKRRRKLKFASGLPERHKRSLSSKEAHFKPAVDVRWISNRLDLVQSALLAVGMGNAGLILFGAIGVSNGFRGAPAEVWEIYGGIILALQLSWLAPGVLYRAVAEGRRRNFRALVDWLGARYGIALGEAQGLPVFATAYYTIPREHSFASASNEALVFTGNSEGYHVSKADNLAEEYPLTLAAKAPQARRQVEVALPRRSRELHGEVERLITKLNQRDLSPESDHVVARAGRDLEKVLEIYVDLHELEAVTEAHQQNIQRVLMQLRVELTEVLQRETHWALNALGVETTYVISREERQGIMVKKGSGAGANR